MRLSNRNLLAVTIGALGIVWCLVIFAVADRFVLFPRYIGAFIFVLTAVVLAILYLTVFRRSPGSQAAESGALTIYLTIAYVAAVMVSNTLFVLNGRGGFNKFLLFSNAIINTSYILLILYAEKDNQRLAEQLERTEQKLRRPVDISARLGEILGLVEDAQLRAQILKLKEAVDYSTNITTGATYESEKRMEQLLEELQELIVRQGDHSAIQNKIHEAELTWRTRGSAASSRG